MGHRREPHAGAQIERADADGSSHLVRGDAHGIDGGGIDGNAPEGLDGVGMEEGSHAVRSLGEFGDGLDDAGLVVRGHDGDERAGPVEDIGERLGLYDAEPVGLDDADIETAMPELWRAFKDGLMLDRGYHDGLATGIALANRLCEPEEREIVALGTARCKNYALIVAV
jgi:hypothetical protein